MHPVALAQLLFRRFAHSDQEAAFSLLRAAGKALLPGYRFVFPQFAWWRDERFNGYLARFGELEGMNSDRRWMVHQLGRMTEQVAGDTAECGVYQGASSYLMCLANSGTAKVHHLFDSFEGVSAPGPRDGSHWTQGDLRCSVDQVKRNLCPSFAAEYHPGWIPDRFHEVESRVFSFVHVDVDLEQPTIDSFRFFYPRLSPGGILLCDDYGFTSCPGASKVLDEYFKDKPEKMISLSGGGGFMIKGLPIGRSFGELPSTAGGIP